MSELPQGARYKLLTALVVPRPIGWITSRSAAGIVNAAPYSFFNVLGNRPPIVAFGPGAKADGSPKDTRTNVEETKEFVVNIVGPRAAEVMHETAAPYPSGESEVERLGLETLPSVHVQVPRLAVSDVHLECRYERTVAIGENRVVFGEVLAMHMPEGLVDPEKFYVTPGAFEAVGRLQGPGRYCTTRDQFDLGRFPDPKIE